MQVITLNPSDFEEHAKKLAHTVEQSGTTCYDAIVGVRRGGSIVCDAFLRHFPHIRYGRRYDVGLQRPSTRHKEGRAGELLKRLPYPLLDTMRKAEALLLALKRRIRGTRPTPHVELPEGLTETLTEHERPEILLIDDAIDSGDTLSAIVETFKKTNPETKTCIAVMTETTRHPRIRSNHTIYRNRTLIRFPWSNDYKNDCKES